jgi:ABC-type transport system involved in multi-copper enzyme maturation permease subunit
MTAIPVPTTSPKTGAWERFSDQLSERLNPIVVKEVRQGLRTRVFWIFFGLMLLACVCISLIAWATAQEVGFDAGRNFFIAFFVCLAVVQFFIIPYTAYRSMAREREDDTWVLLTLTGLGPRRILRGKLSSFIVQGALYGSAAGPFLLFCYYLNGIDLPTILLSVAVGAAWQLFLTSVSVCTATLAEQRITRALMHFTLLGTLLMCFGWGIGGVVAFVEEARNIISDDAFWAGAACVLWLLVSYAVLLFEAAAARLSLPTEPYARGPRLAFFAQSAGVLGFMLWAWHRTSGPTEALVAIHIGGLVHMTFIGLFVSSDVDGMSRRHWTKAGRFDLLKPGALRGFVFTLLCLGLYSAVTLALMFGRTDANEHALEMMAAAPAYAALYLAAPMVLARLFQHHPSQTPILVRVFALGIFMVGAGLPPLVAVICGFDGNQPLFNLLNPIVGLVNISEGHTEWSAVLLLYAVATGWTLLALSMLFARDIRPKEPLP